MMRNLYKKGVEKVFGAQSGVIPKALKDYGYLYRADRRSYDEIKKAGGFNPLSPDYRAVLTGAELRQYQFMKANGGNIISTAKSESAARDFASANQTKEQFYIYKIRAAGLLGYDFSETNGFQNLVYAEQEEVAVDREIPIDNIELLK
ncbi:hypothetical protein BGP78_01595 [Pseudoalteromonas sp. MSK9-3]|uniref:scabin-related ADP-ribosyltransferase n=1 Tax=Pseudoalteromonas sp. MSK9-3 TaxID=1897633 RepID=UPI000E6C3492|nr:hypothetical protein [Pseudoalteromonas sp. MSK9-3]RJE76967.1 hypothetical protein BGP78_01595 [Pseudoalteromonas sp. MSK9-3]